MKRFLCGRGQPWRLSCLLAVGCVLLAGCPGSSGRQKNEDNIPNTAPDTVQNPSDSELGAADAATQPNPDETGANNAEAETDAVTLQQVNAHGYDEVVADQLGQVVLVDMWALW